MTQIQALADCILSGQVSDHAVPALVADTPGLQEELELRSAAMSPVVAVEAGRGDSISSHGALRPADAVSHVTGRLSPADRAFLVSTIRSAAGSTRFDPLDKRPTYGRKPWVIAPEADDAIRQTWARSVLAALNPSNLPRQGPLPHGLGEEESRRPLKTRGFLRQLISSLHPGSFLRNLMRK